MGGRVNILIEKSLFNDSGLLYWKMFTEKCLPSTCDLPKRMI